MIKELTNLSPAEVLLIENPEVTIDKLARVTFFDLVLKEVLKMEVDSKATKKDNKNPTVSLGKTFSSYQPLKHEAIFLSVFARDNELKIKFLNLLKIAFEKIKSSEEYKLKYIYSELRMKQYFQSNFFQKLLGIKVISKDGIKIQKDIKSELKRIRTNTTKKIRGIEETLLALNGNILLIPKIPIGVFELIEKKNTNFRKENNGSIWNYYSYSDLYHLNITKNQFDLIAINDSDVMPIIESVNGFDDSSDDSGCGSDGGCSGCGGCGGCG